MNQLLPQDFLYRMREMLGKDYEAFLSGYKNENYHAFRINTWKTDAASLFSAPPFSSAEGCFHAFEPQPVPWTKDGFYYPESLRFGKHPYHEAGVYYIQEPSAMLPAACLDAQPGEKILDLCAAPGGKSTQIACAMRQQGILVCNEIHPSRAKILSENIERMGIANAIVTNESPQTLSAVFPSYFDKVMVDAPCSGEGMFRKNEEACTQWSLENVSLCAKRQDMILDCADLCLRPGGRLVYSTCTFAPAENEGTISRFLTRHPQYRIVPVPLPKEAGHGHDEWDTSCHNGETAAGFPSSCGLLSDTIRLWPHEVRGEGHFAAILEKGPLFGDSHSVPLFQAEYALDGHTVTPLSKKASLARAGKKSGVKKAGGKSQTSSASLNLAMLSDFLKETLSLSLHGNLTLFGDQIYLLPSQCPDLSRLRLLRQGLHLGTLQKDRFVPSHALALFLKPSDVKNSYLLSSADREQSEACRRFINGEALPAQGRKGWYLVCIDGYSIGWGKQAGTMLKNHYPKGLRKSL